MKSTVLMLVTAATVMLSGNAAAASAFGTPEDPFEQIVYMLQTTKPQGTCQFGPVSLAGPAGERVATATVTAATTPVQLVFHEKRPTNAPWATDEGFFASGVPYWQLSATNADLHQSQLRWSLTLPDLRSLGFTVTMDDGKVIACN